MKKAQRTAVSVGVLIVAGLGASVANTEPVTGDLNVTYMFYHGTRTCFSPRMAIFRSQARTQTIRQLS